MGLEAVVEPWIDGLFPALRDAMAKQPFRCALADGTHSPACLAAQARKAERAAKAEEGAKRGDVMSAFSDAFAEGGMGPMGPIDDDAVPSSLGGGGEAKSEGMNSTALAGGGGVDDSGDGCWEAQAEGEAYAYAEDAKEGEKEEGVDDSGVSRLPLSFDTIMASCPTTTPEFVATVATDKKQLPRFRACNLAVSLIREEQAGKGGEGKGQGKASSSSSSSACHFADFPGVRPGTVCSAEYLTTGGRGASRRVLHLQVAADAENTDKEQGGLDWAPGDAIGIYGRNDTAMVDALLLRLGIQDDARSRIHVGSEGAQGEKKTKSTGSISLPTHCTVLEAFQQHLDVCATPRKAFLRLLSEHCDDTTDQHQLAFLSSRKGKDAYRAVVEQQTLNLLDLLRLFPSCKVKPVIRSSVLPSSTRLVRV